MLSITGRFCFALVPLVYVSCEWFQFGEGCPDCFSPAFVLTFVDAGGNKVTGFDIVVVNARNDSTVTDDFFEGDDRYDIFADAGTYRLQITHDDYREIVLENISVTKGRCDMHTRFFTLLPEPAAAGKLKSNGTVIVADSTGVGCDNK